MGTEKQPPQLHFGEDGLPLAKAPYWLKPYLDAVDGALFVGGSIGGLIFNGGLMPRFFGSSEPRVHRVALFRSGRQVGIVHVEELSKPGRHAK